MRKFQHQQDTLLRSDTAVLLSLYYALPAIIGVLSATLMITQFLYCLSCCNVHADQHFISSRQVNYEIILRATKQWLTARALLKPALARTIVSSLRITFVYLLDARICQFPCSNYSTFCTCSRSRSPHNVVHSPSKRVWEGSRRPCSHASAGSSSVEK